MILVPPINYTSRKLGHKLGLDTPLCLALNLGTYYTRVSARELRAQTLETLRTWRCLKPT